jgi:hypothetical protein
MCFYGGAVCLALWLLLLLFVTAFGTGLGFRHGPAPTSEIYWQEFRATLFHVAFIAFTKLGFITWIFVVVPIVGWWHRRKTEGHEEKA